MPTEDHPLDYGTFEGTIPVGQYGGGTVMLWDRGFWEPEGDADAMMKKGRLTFHLHGKKLKGRWHLVRSQRDEKRPSWLLFKSKDEFANSAVDIESELPDSAKTGRTMDEISSAKKPIVWASGGTKSNSTKRREKSSAKKRPQGRP
jgi:bifunctional non-homologous end joining protein LigD